MDNKTLPFIIIIPAVALIGLSIYFFNQQSLKSQTQNAPTPTEANVNIFPSQSAGQVTNPTEPMKKIKQYAKAPDVLPKAELTNKKAVIKTAKGTIEFEILPDGAPLTASNFIFLAKDGFYNKLTFHRVEPGFVIQGGDPLGNGTGGPGYKFEDEPVMLKYDKGIVAMANAGPDTNGSQFFIMLADAPQLPPNYTIFGRVIKGQDVVDRIAVGDVMQSVTIEPLTN